MALRESDVQPPPPNLSVQVRTEFVTGLSEVSGRLLVLLDVDRILTDEQMGILKSASAA